MKRWKIQAHDSERSKTLGKEIGVSPLIASLLIARGYDSPESARKFISPQFDDLHDPLLLKGMDRAMKRIFKAIENGEKILIWGDYDVDGTTGTVVLRKALSILGAETGYHVPHRFEEGYGLNIPEIEKAKSEGYSVVISVDCGITSFEPAKWAKENGVDLIITDHHLPKSEGNPDAFAVVNPKQAGCEYPDKELAGVGVAFKLAHALLREKGREDLVHHFLKMVAIGTIADVMNLTGENRAIVSIGLADLAVARNKGLKAIMEVADCNSEMTSYDIGFRVGPRINAAGRMDAAKHVVEMFETNDYAEARKLAEYLNKKNIERRTVQQDITERAILQAKAEEDLNFVVVSGENWHRGVIGLAAGRIAEKMHRPTIVLSIDEEGMAHGSARSIENFHLLDALDTCSELFVQFGGHAAAAGMKIAKENIDELRDRLNTHATIALSDEDLIPEIRIDAELNSEDLNLGLVDALKVLEPCGAGNPTPIFATKGLRLTASPIVMKDIHLKLWIADANGKTFQAVWWDGVNRLNGQTLDKGDSIEIAYVPQENIWQGRNLQLEIKDLRKV